MLNTILNFCVFVSFLLFSIHLAQPFRTFRDNYNYHWKNIGKRITLLCVCSHLKHAQPFPVEWSPSEKFSRESTNGIEIFDLKKFETVVNFLKSGCRYFFRIAFGNFQGYGRFQNCTPFSVVPSCKLIAYIFSFRMNKKSWPWGLGKAKSIFTRLRPTHLHLSKFILTLLTNQPWFNEIRISQQLLQFYKHTYQKLWQLVCLYFGDNDMKNSLFLLKSFK